MKKIKEFVFESLEDELIDEDEERDYKDNKSIQELYLQANEETKKVIDKIFVHLCGHQMDSVIEIAEEGDPNSLRFISDD